jgi:hypothetical protein
MPPVAGGDARDFQRLCERDDGGIDKTRIRMLEVPVDAAIRG